MDTASLAKIKRIQKEQIAIRISIVICPQKTNELPPN